MVGELGAEDDDLVEAVAAVDRDRGVDVVLDLVLAAAGPDVGLGRGREATRQSRHGDLVGHVAPHDLARRVVHAEGARAVAGGLGEREGADDEQVVVVVALEPQLRLVRVDDEGVVAGAARDEQRWLLPALSQPRVVATVGNWS